ncbi:MAG: hypothetical protein GOV02_01755 [Candidatus Aenigmarchaeota archaeon]|nr:hypothetical protein [Candidatus Aenigmarchaeota archaeon]
MLNVGPLDEKTFNYIADHIELVGKEKDFHVYHMNYRKAIIPNDFESLRLVSGDKNVLYMVGKRTDVPITSSFLDIGVNMQVGDEGNYLLHVINGEAYCTQFDDDHRKDTGLGIGVLVNYNMTIERAERGKVDSNPIYLPKIHVETGPDSVIISKLCLNHLDIELWDEFKQTDRF